MIKRWMSLSVLLIVLAGCGANPIKEESPERKASRTNVELGLGYLRQGKHKLALERLQRAVVLDPGFAGANHALALAYQEFGQPHEARRYFRRALRQDSKDSNLANNYGTFLCQQGDYEEAEEYFVRAAKDPTYGTPGRAWENAGLCLVEGGKYRSAEKYLRSALKLIPDLPMALAAMARVSFEKKNYLSTRAYLQRFEAHRPLNAQMLWLAVQTERALGDGKAAQRNVMKLRSKFPDSREAAMAMAR